MGDMFLPSVGRWLPSSRIFRWRMVFRVLMIAASSAAFVSTGTIHGVIAAHCPAAMLLDDCQCRAIFPTSGLFRNFGATF